MARLDEQTCAGFPASRIKYHDIWASVPLDVKYPHHMPHGGNWHMRANSHMPAAFQGQHNKNNKKRQTSRCLCWLAVNTLMKPSAIASSVVGFESHMAACCKKDGKGSSVEAGSNRSCAHCREQLEVAITCGLRGNGATALAPSHMI